MKSIDTYINEKHHMDVLTAETFLKKDNLEHTFLALIDDASYNLSKEFGIEKTSAEIAEIVIKAMEKYKNFR